MTVPATLVIVTVPVWKVLFAWVVVALKVARVPPWWKTDPRPPRMTRLTSAFWNSLPARPGDRAGSGAALAVAVAASRGIARTVWGVIRKAATGCDTPPAASAVVGVFSCRKVLKVPQLHRKLSLPGWTAVQLPQTPHGTLISKNPSMSSDRGVTERSR
jgi:hypothetical protein